MRGRKPIPTALKKTRGTLRKSRANTREPIPPGGDLRPPASFDVARLALWNCFIENAPEGLLRPLDGPMLAVLVDAVIEHRIAAAELKTEGAVLATANGHMIPNPRMAVLNRMALLSIKVAAELGFTPASRGRLGLPPPEPEFPADPWLSLRKS